MITILKDFSKNFQKFWMKYAKIAEVIKIFWILLSNFSESQSFGLIALIEFKLSPFFNDDGIVFVTCFFDGFYNVKIIFWPIF